MLEACQYKANAFVTLTYSDEQLPGTDTFPGGNLVPKDLQDWLKRLRKSMEPERIRFFAVGEYGDQTERPHFHAAIFNYPTCSFGRSRYSARITSCCPSCDNIKDTWGKGNVLLGILETSSAQYIAGYVTKKMTAKDDERLGGRHPEFARMSLRPGIGAGMMDEVASTWMSHDLGLASGQPDVPSALAHGGRNLPLGRYLRRRLRVLVGMDPKSTQYSYDKSQEEVRSLQEAAKTGEKTLKELLIEAGTGRVASMTARQKIFKSKRNL